MIYIFILLFILTLILTLKLKINLNYKVKYKNQKSSVDDIILNNNLPKQESYILICVFYFIPIFKLKLNKEKKKNKNEKDYNIKKLIGEEIINSISNFFKGYIKYEKTNKFYFNHKDANKISKHLKYEEIDLSLGINFYEPIVNAYAISFINALLNIYIAKNIKNINLKKTVYNTYISSEIYNIRLKIKGYINGINILTIILKVIIKYLKLNIKLKTENNIKRKVV